jgi:hypothetical protein
MKRYRIVTDRYSGFEVQMRVWWWPFWLQCGRRGGRGTNTFEYIADADKFAAEHSRMVKPPRKKVGKVVRSIVIADE